MVKSWEAYIITRFYHITDAEVQALRGCMSIVNWA